MPSEKDKKRLNDSSDGVTPVLKPPGQEITQEDLWPTPSILDLRDEDELQAGEHYQGEE